MIYSAQFLNIEELSENAVISIDVNPFSYGAEARKVVLICKNGTPLIALRIFVEIDEDGCILEQCFEEIMLNDKSVAILYGQHVHLFDVESYEVRSINLHDYVGHIYSVPNTMSNILSEFFIVTTFLYTFFINLNSGVIWQSEQCAIDGVVIHEIKDNVIYGSGEWDPPGGWKLFSLSLNNGEFIY